MTTPTRGAAEFAAALRQLPLPIGLIDLRSGNVVAVSERALAFRALAIDAVLDRPVLEGLHLDDRPGAAAALEAMAKGNVDFFRVRELALAEDAPNPLTAWVRRIDGGDRELALFELAEASDVPASALAAFVGSEPFEMAVGSLDETGKVMWISQDISTLIGVSAEALVGTELITRVQRDEVERVLEAGRSLGRDHAVGLRIHVRDSAGEWRPVHLILATLAASSPLRLFILTPGDDPADDPAARVADLQYHLWKIAGEVEAAGIITRMGAVPNAHLLPEHGTLTTRQWDVLGRLIRGDRVPTIARDLVLSQSTVRGHVATILRRFGVRSQPELLELFRTTTSPS